MEDQNNNRLRIVANLEEEEETSVKDFTKVLGSTVYTEPKVIKDTIKILVPISKMAVKLAVDQPCIVSMGYIYDAELIGELDQPIV